MKQIYILQNFSEAYANVDGDFPWEGWGMYNIQRHLYVGWLATPLSNVTFSYTVALQWEWFDFELQQNDKW